MARLDPIKGTNSSITGSSGDGYLYLRDERLLHKYVFLRQFSEERISWEELARTAKLTEEFMREYVSELNWETISRYQKLSLDMMMEMRDRIHWETASRCQAMDSNTLNLLADRVNWNTVLGNNKNVDLGLILRYRQHIGPIGWQIVSRDYTIPEKYLWDLAESLDWELICVHQKLPERFISNYKDRVNWKAISRHQKLSEGFVTRFSASIDWDELEKNEKFMLSNGAPTKSIRPGAQRVVNKPEKKGLLSGVVGRFRK